MSRVASAGKPPEPPPADFRVRRRLPELGDVPVRGEDNARGPVRDAIEPFKTDEAIRFTRQRPFAIAPLASVVKPDEEHLRAHPVEHVHERPKLEQRQGLRIGQQEKLSMADDLAGFALSDHLDAQ